MSVLTIRLPDEHHARLKALAKSRGLSVNKLIEHLSLSAITEFDVETRFKVRAAMGNPTRGLEILDMHDKHFENEG